MSWDQWDDDTKEKKIREQAEDGRSRKDAAKELKVPSGRFYRFVNNRGLGGVFQKQKESGIMSRNVAPPECNRLSVSWLDAVRGGFCPRVGSQIFLLENPKTLTLDLICELRILGLTDYDIAEGFGAPVALVKGIDAGYGSYGI